MDRATPTALSHTRESGVGGGAKTGPAAASVR